MCNFKSNIDKKEKPKNPDIEETSKKTYPLNTKPPEPVEPVPVPT